MQTIIVVGGGAGGLELVTKINHTLSRKKWGKQALAKVILVDRSPTHVWKPLLHEVAAGVIDKNSDGIDYAIHAARHGYQFQLGNVSDIDPQAKLLTIDSLDDEQGQELLPKRQLNYDYLVMATGSVSNDFGTPGVAEHAYFLDSLAQAEKFHRALLNQLLRVNQLNPAPSIDEQANTHATPKPHMSIAIVGGGATGTELAAELHHIANLAKAYGMPEMSAQRLKVTIIEAGPRILPALPERISHSARKALHKLGIDIRENTRIASAQKGAFVTSEGEAITADLLVWAAGVKAPDWLQSIGIFNTNKAQQILVNPFLQAQEHRDIFAIGDCCGFQQADGSWVPPRAQSAHQMAATAAHNIAACIKGDMLKAYRYTDYGSLVHLSRYSTVGSLMGKLNNSSMFVEGRMAALVYVSLYNMHQFAVHGWLKGFLVLLSRKVGRIVSPALKLH